MIKGIVITPLMWELLNEGVPGQKILVMPHNSFGQRLIEERKIIECE